MIVSAIAIFALAAILGMLLLSAVLQDKPTPKAVVFTHGPLAVIGVILLIIYCTKNEPSPMESLIIFIIAALGGLIMVTRDLMNKPIPKWLAIIHGLGSISGFVLLLIFQFK